MHSCSILGIWSIQELIVSWDKAVYSSLANCFICSSSHFLLFLKNCDGSLAVVPLDCHHNYIRLLERPNCYKGYIIVDTDVGQKN